MSNNNPNIVPYFQSLDAASLATFQTDSVSFVRAMDLYGVSLRKGETPDEISRKGEASMTSVKCLGSIVDVLF